MSSHITAVAAVEEIKNGHSKLVEINGEGVAVFRIGDDFFAISNACPHHGADLCEGYLREKTVFCPRHGWQFDLQTGAGLTVPGMDAKTFEVKVEAGQVWLVVE